MERKIELEGNSWFGEGMNLNGLFYDGLENMLRNW